MIIVKPLKIRQIKLNVFIHGNYVCTVDEFECLDIRRQICEQHLEGYSLMIDSKYWDLWDKEVDIRAFIVRLTPDGEFEGNWFPEYKLNDEYGYVGVFSETFAVVKKIRITQMSKKSIDE